MWGPLEGGGEVELDVVQGEDEGEEGIGEESFFAGGVAQGDEEEAEAVAGRVV